MMSDLRPRVLILGAGFAGIGCAKALARAPVDVTIVDRQNHHLFQPLLYQVATAALAAPDIAAPVRRIFRRQKNVTVLLDAASAVDVEKNEVSFTSGATLPFDFLVVATGARHTYFGNDAWEENAPGLKTIADAFEIRRRILLAFEEAERETDAAKVRAALTFVVVGGGPTGVELAGAIAEIARRTLVSDFRRFDPSSARVILVERGDRVLGAYPEDLSRKAKAQLEQLGVDVWLKTPVTKIDDGGVTLDQDRIAARTVLWAAGVEGSPLARTLGVPLAPNGRVPVDPSLALAEHKNVFITGDLALVTENGVAVPALAPAALQMGRSVGENITRTVRGKPTKPFHYVDKGSLATVGRRRAVGVVFGIPVSGFLAWLGWLFIHLMYLVGFRNRLAVLFDWIWAYVSYQRSARVIIEPTRRVSLSTTKEARDEVKDTVVEKERRAG